MRVNPIWKENDRRVGNTNNKWDIEPAVRFVLTKEGAYLFGSFAFLHIVGRYPVPSSFWPILTHAFHVQFAPRPILVCQHLYAYLSTCNCFSHNRPALFVSRFIISHRQGLGVLQ